MEVEEEGCGSSQDDFCIPDNSINPVTTEALNAETINQDPAPSTSGMVSLSSRKFRVNKNAKKKDYLYSRRIDNICSRNKTKERRMKLAKKEPDIYEIKSGVSCVAHYEYIFVGESDKKDIPELDSGVYQVLEDKVIKMGKFIDDEAPKTNEDKRHDTELLKGLIKFCKKHGLKAKDSLMKQQKLMCNFSSLLKQPQLLEGQVPDQVIALLKNCQIK